MIMKLTDISLVLFTRYGYTPLPRVIEGAEYMTRFARLTNDVQLLASAWYHVDENADPPVYVLKSLERMDDDSF